MFLSRLKAWAFRAYYDGFNRRVWRGCVPGTQLKVSNLIIPGRAGPLPARMYHGRADRPLMLYFHGGGWCIGNLETHDPFCRALAEACGCTLLSLDYRLAPEHPFPAAHDDCLDATHWVLEHLESLAPNDGKLVLAGDSAGGNLTACTVASLPGVSELVGALMIYPATEHYLAGLPSFREHAKSKPLTFPILKWFVDTYLGRYAPADPQTKTMFVSRRTDYKHFPPSLIVTAERDPLRDDGKRLAITLRQAGVTVTYQHFPNEAHGFACSEGPTEGHREFIALASQWFNTLPSAQ